MDEECEVIVLGTGLKECILSGLLSVDGVKISVRFDLRLYDLISILGLAVSFVIFAYKSHKQKFKKKIGLPGCTTVCVNLSAKEILELADDIIYKSLRVHDAVALVPLDKLSYENVVLPLSELEATQLSLIQCCVFPKMLSLHSNVRKASVEAEEKIDAHILSCRKREDVYQIVKLYAAKGESIAPEAKRYLQCLMVEVVTGHAEFINIRTLGMLRSRFQSIPGAFNNCLVPNDKGEDATKKGFMATFSRKFDQVGVKGLKCIGSHCWEMMREGEAEKLREGEAEKQRRRKWMATAQIDPDAVFL